MAAEQSEFSQRAAELTEGLKRIRGIQEQVVATVRQLQDVLLFGAHPELTDLDDELDILYRGQL